MHNTSRHYNSDEDSKHSSNVTHREIVTILTEEDSERQSNVYPSSPMVLERESQILEIKSVNNGSNTSIELNVPFYQDLSTSIEGDLSTLARNEVTDVNTINRRKRLLDEILDESSSYSGKLNEELYDHTSSCAKNTPPGGGFLRRTKVDSTPAKFGTTLVIEHEGDDVHGCPTRENRCQDSCSSVNFQDLIEAFPLSPICNSAPDYEKCLPIDSRPLTVQEACTTPSNLETTNDLFSKPSQEYELQANKPEIIELSAREFLTERIDKVVSTPSKHEYHTFGPQNSSTSNTSNTIKEPTTSEREIRRLQHYIVQGNCLSRTQSEALVRDWLQRNKSLFKQVNQIHRDNVKARESIVVEIPGYLLEQFEKGEDNIKELLLPATLEAVSNQELPLLRFLRECNSTYDFNNDVYYPSESVTLEETIVMLYYDAQIFFERYRSDKTKLYNDLKSLSSGEKYLIVILSGLNRFKRSLQAQENKRYKNRVQVQLGGSQKGVQSVQIKKRRTFEDLNMTYFDVAQRIQHIDRMWGVKIHTVSSDADFIKTLPNLVSIIGKQRTDPNIRFMRYCHINVKSCKDEKEVLMKSLREINRMPELKASSVVAAYSSFQSLLKDFERREIKSGLDGKHLMTEAMEERLFKLLTCRDPNETIQ
ncbi:hypothetical protein HG535_0A02420 [Zygotorulaspora mrakii]|uniref:ERCC4 domain-containing protein n=1 Tax=Zygotorulaspora mrakii TaxID=42260 RepID=A0A7H9AW43_ZYGMR|nr:uncharacterized protein HG535_0A02420 [Zygotorulaspora mrakii]QLG70304.1 hypothetical protein HG535_0A02420 [Zygotorulaspora mrakii]